MSRECQYLPLHYLHTAVTSRYLLTAVGSRYLQNVTYLMCDVTGRQCQHQHHCREVAKLIAVSGQRGAQACRLQSTEQMYTRCYTEPGRGPGPGSTDNQNEECHSESLHSELRLKVFRLAGMLRNIRIILKNVPVLGCCGAQCIAAVHSSA